MKPLAAALAVVCAVLAVALASTHSTTKTLVVKPPSSQTMSLDTAKVEDAIRTSIRLQRSMDAVVRCPRVEPQEAGTTFTCTATTHRVSVPHAAVYTPFAVTVQNARGYSTYVGR